jgi:hypothetical protein
MLALSKQPIPAPDPSALRAPPAIVAAIRRAIHPDPTARPALGELTAALAPP